MYLGDRRFVSEKRELHTGHQEQLFVCDWLSPLSLSATERAYSEGDHSMDDGLLVLSAVHKMSHPHRCGVCSGMDVLLILRRPRLLGSLESSIHRDGTSKHTGRSSASKRIPCHPQVSIMSGLGSCGRKSRNHLVRSSKAFRIRRALWSPVEPSKCL